MFIDNGKMAVNMDLCEEIVVSGTLIMAHTNHGLIVEIAKCANEKAARELKSAILMAYDMGSRRVCYVGGNK